MKAMHVGHDQSVDGLVERSAGSLSVQTQSVRVPIEPLQLLPSGATVEMKLPQELATYSAIVVFEDGQRRGFGFQVMPRGLGALSLPPDISTEVEGPVALGAGEMAFFREVDLDEPAKGLAVWQGQHHDIVTFDYVDLSDAVAGFARVRITDAAVGALIVPIDRITRERHEALTVEAGDLVYDVTPLTLRPVSPGAPAKHGALYWRNDTTLMFVSESATVHVNRWRLATGKVTDEELGLTDADIADVTAGLSAIWVSADGATRQSRDRTGIA